MVFLKNIFLFYATFEKKIVLLKIFSSRSCMKLEILYWTNQLYVCTLSFRKGYLIKKMQTKNWNFKWKIYLLITVVDDGLAVPTPTLRQLFLTIRQIQFDLQEIKSQLNQERTQRGNLQQLVMNHIEKCNSGSG